MLRNSALSVMLTELERTVKENVQKNLQNGDLRAPTVFWLLGRLLCAPYFFCFLEELKSVRGAGDESGLGRQICWGTASRFGSRFLKVNFAAKKQDLGCALMNQLSVGEKRFPRSDQDIAADFFALRKFHTGTRWVFSEGRNPYNPASHCDIAWAAALATHAHSQFKNQLSSRLGS